MKNIRKPIVTALSISVLSVGLLTGLASASSPQGGAPDATTFGRGFHGGFEGSGEQGHGRMRGFGLRGDHAEGMSGGFGGHHLSIGTKVSAELYAGTPEAKGKLLKTLTYTVGEDSEVAFAQQLAEAKADAGTLVIKTGEQTQTTKLSSQSSAETRAAPLYLPIRHLNLGSKLTATFYDGDPEQGGKALKALSFVYGEDSEIAFEQALQAAKAEATYLQVTTSPQEQTIDLAALASSQDHGLRHGDAGEAQDDAGVSGEAEEGN